jgi:hypothetical protein
VCVAAKLPAGQMWVWGSFFSPSCLGRLTALRTFAGMLAISSTRRGREEGGGRGEGRAVCIHPFLAERLTPSQNQSQSQRVPANDAPLLVHELAD